MSVFMHTACAKQKEKQTYTSTRTWTSLFDLRSVLVLCLVHMAMSVYGCELFICALLQTYWCIFKKFIKLFQDCLIILAVIFVSLFNRFLVYINVH